MPDAMWHEAVAALRPHVLQISTPRGSGTGFLISNGQASGICGIATAAHVLDAANYWEEPIRVFHETSGHQVLLRSGQRAIILDHNRDTAALVFPRGEFQFPAQVLPMIPQDQVLKVGHEVGWLGYPAFPGTSMCFFSGRVSAYQSAIRAYLVDGVAINGVSGGPAIHLGVEGAPSVIMGVVSAYMPNRATGEVLPGLSVIRDVSQLHELAPTFSSLEEAIERQPPPKEPVLETSTDGGESTSRRG